MAEDALCVWRERDEGLLRLRLNQPKANILDQGMVGALQEAFEHSNGDKNLRAVLLDAAGPNFSYGASIQEHLPESCADMLKRFHALVLTMLRSPIPILVTIRGQCLGGGLELASAGHILFAEPRASLGQPEIRLGVFAPVASCLLPERIGRAAADDLLISGRSISGVAALKAGLVTAVSEDVEKAALDYFDEHVVSKSAAALKYALRAARLDMTERVAAKLMAVEKLYLTELMSSGDAVEGLTAFLQRRPPRWRHE
jgi:cyclohexa-1,5-dienecarbonyl-CoA hydratase